MKELWLLLMMMMIIIIELVLGEIYVFESRDDMSVESYDCISIVNEMYCRRPSEMIDLYRNDSQCYHGGQIHWFDELQSKQMPIEQMLHEWKSTIEQVDKYARYLNDQSNDYLCECRHRQSFGKHCEYLLPFDEINVDQTLNLINEMKLKLIWDVQLNSDIICYRRLTCNSGLLCLDWRNICDGIQQCMFGLDEENCDLLELNECSDDEYRCSNGMCIPDEYFLDGEFDCLDWSDEIGSYDDRNCALKSLNSQCENHQCQLNEWSCGDGQCIRDRLAFQKANKMPSECVNRRDQYFLCETHYSQPMWTLNNGKCHFKGYQQTDLIIQSQEEQCNYFLRCGLSAQAEYSCPCGRQISCKQFIERICPSESMLYPQGPIVAPYVFYFYNRTRTRGKFAPDYIQLNGTLKCQNSFVDFNEIQPFSYNLTLQTIVDFYCPKLNSNGTTRTRTRQKMSSLNPNHRFRCSSSNESSWLSVNLLGDGENDCSNRFDELWLGEQKKLSDMNCNDRLRDECHLIRQYVESSWKSSSSQRQQPTISFRSYCDTFWHLNSKQDENIELCQRSWKCSSNEWQCRTGQCIDKNWLFDGEWDCSDASDEQPMLNNSFNEFCDPNTEFLCLRIETLNPMDNLTLNRPCVSLSKIGDGHIDCHGAIDERNTMELCDESGSMLGYNYWCQSSGSCIPYWLICAMTCPNIDDDQFQCTQRQNTSTCGNIEDFVCLNGTCIINGRCNQIRDCFNGEDEYMCDYQGTKTTTTLPYRKQKQFQRTNQKKIIELEQHQFIDSSNSNVNQSKDESLPLNWTSQLFGCNRGFPVYSLNGSIVCLCPIYYYGDRCEFYGHRLNFLFHLNISLDWFILKKRNESSMMFKLVVLFQYENETLSIEQMSVEEILFRKTLLEFVYPRWFQQNPNRYSISIEMYELKSNEKPLLIAFWRYKIEFDFLPVVRLSKVLRLNDDNCSLNVSLNEDCHDNDDDVGYCSSKSICKSRLTRGKLPICICPLNRFGDRCELEYDQCSLNPCKNQGQCYPKKNPREFVCLCDDEFYGDRCQLKKSQILLNFDENLGRWTSVIQYFRIEYVSLDLILIDQKIVKDELGSLESSFGQDLVPEIVLMKLYESYQDMFPKISLVSLNLNRTFVNKTIRMNETTKCVDIRREKWKDRSPIEYHRLCGENRSLECFYDDWYLCLCSFDDNHVECLTYDHRLDQCSYCLSNGRCLKGNPNKINDFICLCPECHSGFQCQFSSDSFAFTLDQLFYIDLISSSKQRTVILLIIVVCSLMLIVSLPSNLFSLLTFRRRKCLLNNVGHYLSYLSIINELNIIFVGIRLIHLSLIVTNVRLSFELNNLICKMLSYSLSCSIRLSDWLSCLVGVERVYSSVVLKRCWFQQVHIIRRMFTFICLTTFLSSIYELKFMRAFSENVNNNSSNHHALCVIDFTGEYRSMWRIVHQTVSITHSILPILINICCTITIICVIIKNKMKINRFNRRSNISDTSNLSRDVVKEETTMNRNEDLSSPSESHHRFDRLREVLRDNRDVLTRPTIMLVPSIFSLFSLPLFIVSFTFGCRNIETSPFRYVLITFYLISFIPQIITFILYVYPSSIYSNEWKLTIIGKYLHSH